MTPWCYGCRKLAFSLAMRTPVYLSQGAGYWLAGDDALIQTGRAVVNTVLAAASGAYTLLFYGSFVTEFGTLPLP